MNIVQLKLYPKHIGYTCFEYLLALALILNCRSIWMAAPTMGWFSSAVLFLAGISAIGCIVCAGRYNIAKICNGIWVMLILAGWAILFLMINRINASGWIRIVAGMEMLVLYHIFCDKGYTIPNLLYKYEKLVIAICMVSLFFWFFGTFLGIIGSTGSIQSNWTGQKGVTVAVKSYYGIYYETQKINFLNKFILTRNTAIFTEAPMCSFHFCLAFLIELFLKRNSDRKLLWILGVGVLTTIASSGYIVIMLALFANYIIRQPRDKAYRIIKLFIIPILIITVIVVVENLIYNKMQGTSGTTRIDDFIAGYKAWMDHPLLGNGYGNEDAYIQYMTKSARRSNNYGFSNSPMQILAYGGVYMIAPYIFSIIIGITNYIKRKQWKLLSFEMLFMILFIITIVPFQLLTIYIFIFFTEYILEKNYIECENEIV